VLTLLVAFAVALVTTLLIVRGAMPGNGWTAAMDGQMDGPQKFHAAPVPRTGGLGIVWGLVVALLLVSFQHHEAAGPGWWLLLCAAPVFVAGLAEDLTKRVGPAVRLSASIGSALLAAWLLGASLQATGIPLLDMLVAGAVGSIALTAFAVAGISNAVNIIDGFNGLASMCTVIMLGALAYVAFQVGDTVVMTLALAMIGAVLGFFVWNFPAGLVFLGDGGAYFIGFWFAELSVLLLVRNPGEVSPLTPLLICIYPVFETLFSIYRRRLRGTSPGMPDGIHLHTLIYRRVLRWAVPDRSARAMTLRNSMTAPYLWFVCMLSVIPAMLFWDHTPLVGLFVGLFVLSYLALYWRIVRFRSPGWLHTTRRRLLRQQPKAPPTLLP
jgi:UDP-N-acetylmuramyl pentapeptide phosphotransferase/UDP-N-acetylglucosamine-1-phosphate transferase